MSKAIDCLNAPSGAGCFLTPASGGGVVVPLPGDGAPPASQAPCGAGRHCPYLTTFRRPDAKRHRRPLRCLRPPTSDEIKPKDRRFDLWLQAQPAVVEVEPGPGLGVRNVSPAEPPGRPAGRSGRRRAACRCRSSMVHCSETTNPTASESRSTSSAAHG